MPRHAETGAPELVAGPCVWNGAIATMATTGSSVEPDERSCHVEGRFESDPFIEI